VVDVIAQFHFTWRAAVSLLSFIYMVLPSVIAQFRGRASLLSFADVAAQIQPCMHADIWK